MLRRSVEEHEERKLRYLGGFYASLVFDEGVRPGEANYLLRLAGGLTYGQFQCLALIASREYESEMILIDAARSAGLAPGAEGGIAQIVDLTQTGLVGVISEGRVVSPQAMYGGFEPTSLKLGQLRPTNLGAELHRLLRLEQIRGEELVRLLEELGFERLD